MRRGSSIASKSPVNLPANFVRRGVRVDVGGAGPRWGAWGHPRDAASAVRAVAAIRLRRKIVIFLAEGAGPAECGHRAGGKHYTLVINDLARNLRGRDVVTDVVEIPLLIARPRR